MRCWARWCCLLHNDGQRLDDIRGLHAERDLLRVAGFGRLPSVCALGSRRLLALRGRTEVYPGH